MTKKQRPLVKRGRPRKRVKTGSRNNTIDIGSLVHDSISRNFNRMTGGWIYFSKDKYKGIKLKTMGKSTKPSKSKIRKSVRKSKRKSKRKASK